MEKKQNKPKLVIVSGSVRDNSLTRRVAYYLEKEFSNSFESELIDLRDWALPSVEVVWQTRSQAPQAFQSLWDKINQADAFILVSPEFNGSYSPALKNLIDHMPKSAYYHKPVGIVTASPGAMGGIRASQQLLLLALGLFAVPSPVMLITPSVDKKFDEYGNLIDENFYNSVKTFIDEYNWLSEALYVRRNQLVNV